MAANNTTADPMVSAVVVGLLPLMIAVTFGAMFVRVFLGRKSTDHLIILGALLIGGAAIFGYLPIWAAFVAMAVVVASFAFPIFQSSGSPRWTSSSFTAPPDPLDELKMEMSKLTLQLAETKSQLDEKTRVEATMTEELAEAEDEIYELEEKLREAEKYPETLQGWIPGQPRLKADGVHPQKEGDEA